MFVGPFGVCSNGMNETKITDKKIYCICFFFCLLVCRIFDSSIFLWVKKKMRQLVLSKIEKSWLPYLFFLVYVTDSTKVIYICIGLFFTFFANKIEMGWQLYKIIIRWYSFCFLLFSVTEFLLLQRLVLLDHHLSDGCLCESINLCLSFE